MDHSLETLDDLPHKINRKVREPQFPNHLHIETPFADDIFCLEWGGVVGRRFPPVEQDVVVLPRPHDLVNSCLPPLQQFLGAELDELKHFFALSCIFILGVRHEHKDPIPKLHVDEDTRAKYLFALIPELPHLVAVED